MMKRTKNINQETFRKSWRSYRLAPVALAVSAVFMLAGCEKTDETVSLYQMLMIAHRRIRPRVQSAPPLTIQPCKKRLKLRLNTRPVKIVWQNLASLSVLKLLLRRVWYQHPRLKPRPQHHSKAAACGCH